MGMRRLFVMSAALVSAGWFEDRDEFNAAIFTGFFALATW